MNQERFDLLVSQATARLTGDEVLLASIEGEETDFVRFNGGRIRQAGSVEQSMLSLELIVGGRHARTSVQMGAIDDDQHRVDLALAALRDQLPTLPEDPYLLFNTAVTSSDQVTPSALPTPTDALERIRTAAGDDDLVGIYTAGATSRGFANSLGQRNWFETSTFNFDWTFYLHGDKAAKNLYAGFAWDDDQFAARVDWSRRQLDALARTPIDLAPGAHRTYLTPSAIAEVMGLLSWQSFSIRAHRTKQTALLRMIDGDARLHPELSITENTAEGVAPNFQEQGFLRPDEIALITAGAYADTLVSPRSAREYGVETNGAAAGEYPDSLAIAAGAIPSAGVLEALGTGLYVGNLWYTNFSDRPACRVTGMTRFATFWVEDGEIVAPVNVLRFDDTVFNIFGEQLAGLTDQAEVLLDSESYGQRSNASLRSPGALVNELRYTL